MNVGDNRLYTNVIRKVWVRVDQFLLKYSASPPDIFFFFLQKSRGLYHTCSNSELIATLVTTGTQAMLKGLLSLVLVYF